MTFLERESVRRGKYLKAYFVYGNEKNYDEDERRKELEKIGRELNLKNTALTFVPSMQDSESEVNLNRINPSAANTIIIFRQRNIIAKFIDLKPSAESFKNIVAALDNSTSKYFSLPKIHLED